MGEESNTNAHQDRLKWEEIVKGCTDNQRSAQEQLYRHFFPIMERMVLRHTQDDDKIIDILNDGFLRVFQKIHLYNFSGSFEGWIRRIMYHSISNYFRKYKNDLKFLIYDDINHDGVQKAQHDLYYQDLVGLIDKLPEKHMKVFHLYAIEGFEHKEISEKLNMNNNTCRWYLAEARKLLQKEYYEKYTNKLNEAG